MGNSSGRELYSKAKAYQLTGNIEKAKKYYLKAINKKNVQSMNEYGLILKKENKIKEAKEYFIKCKELNYPYGIFNYAVILENENEINDALVNYLDVIIYCNKISSIELMKKAMICYCCLLTDKYAYISNSKLCEIEKK